MIKKLLTYLVCLLMCITLIPMSKVEEVKADGYTVTYDSNDATSGSVPIDSTVYATGESVTVLDNTGSLTKTGFIFNGWYTSSGGNATEYAVGSTYTIGSDNVTLYANWVKEIKFDLNGATGTAPDTIKSRLNIQLSLDRLTGITNNGKKFAGWSLDKEASSGFICIQLDDSLFSGSDNITLYAIWANYDYLYYNGKSSSNKIIYGFEPNIPCALKEGETIIAFSSDTAINLYVDTTVNNPGYNSSIIYTADKDYAVKWELASTHFLYLTTPKTIKFDLNDGTGTAPSNTLGGSGSYIQLPNQGNITREGYQFIGWNTNKDATVKLTEDDYGYRILDGDIVGNEITFYAVWNEIHTCNEVSYGITLDNESFKGGELQTGNYYLNADVVLTSPIEIPTGAIVNICLNDHVLDLSHFHILNRGTLTITDCGDTVRYFTDEKKVVADWDNALEKWYTVISDGQDGSYETYKGNTIDTANSIAITGGVITNGWGCAEQNITQSFGGAICNLNGAILNIKNGNIIGNIANFGIIYNEGTFNLSGGNIIGNNSADTGYTYQYNDNTNYDGGFGAIYNTSTGNIIISGGEISYNTAMIGAGIYNYGNVTISGGKISHNTLKTWYKNNNFGGFGAGIYNNGYYYGTLTITGGEISYNTCGKSGGGIYNYGYAAITGGVISHNKADYGAGIYNDGTLTISNGEISNNTANDEAGGLFNYGTLTITGGEISNNTAVNCGGGLFNYYRLEISGGEISYNEASRGGGIYYNGYYNDGFFTITGGTISHNEGEYGAGIYNKGSLTISDGEISYNTASESGGGIYNYSYYNGRSMLIKGGEISHNKAAYGAAICNDGTSTISNGEISNNTASNSGGGIYNYYRIEITAGKILNNKANYGAGIYNNSYYDSNNLFSIIGGEISYNIASTCGGGIYNYGAMTISGGEISHNIGEYGAGILNDKTLTISNGKISNNAAYGYGAGIYNYYQLEITAGEISYNEGVCGAGIYNNGYYDNENILSITGGEFKNNIASNSGGGIYNYGAMTMSSGEISHNKANYGAGIYNDGTSTISNGEISYNEASMWGSGILVSGQTTITGGKIIKNVITNNDETIFVGCGGAGIDHYNNNNLTLGGTVVIKDNLTNGIQDNVIIENNSETITLNISNETPLANNAYISVRLIDASKPFVTGLAANNSLQYFVSDDDNFKVNSVNTGTYAYYLVHCHDEVLFENAIDSSFNEVTLTTGNYYLTSDITLSSNVTIPQGNTVNLCLNGYTITYSDYEFINNGTFNISYCDELSINENIQTYDHDGSSKSFKVEGTNNNLSDYVVNYALHNDSHEDSGWSTTAPKEAGSYDIKITRAADDTYRAYSKTIISGLVIKMVYKPILLIPHDVIFHNLEGINMELPTSIEFQNNISLEDIKPTKKGYIFEGFYRDSNYKYKVDTLVYNIVEEVYAKWSKEEEIIVIEPKTYNITYILNEGIITSTSYSTTIKENDTIINLPIVVKEGYTLDGYYINDSKIIDNTVSSINSDITITIKWIKNETPITYTNTQFFVGRVYRTFLRDIVNLMPTKEEIIEVLKDDPIGTNYWVDELDRGIQQGNTFVYNLFLSNEYQSSLSKEGTILKQYKKFVEDVYRAMQGRLVEQVGLDYWINDLVNGQTYKQVIDNIARSKEFNNICKEYNIKAIKED